MFDPISETHWVRFRHISTKVASGWIVLAKGLAPITPGRLFSVFVIEFHGFVVHLQLHEVLLSSLLFLPQLLIQLQSFFNPHPAAVQRVMCQGSA